MKIATVEQFVAACKDLKSQEIYDLFMDETKEAVRNEIYSVLTLDELEEASEPTRLALQTIGFTYSMKSLQEY